jgi:hypothetical protein
MAPRRDPRILPVLALVCGDGRGPVTRSNGLGRSETPRLVQMTRRVGQGVAGGDRLHVLHAPPALRRPGTTTSGRVARLVRVTQVRRIVTRCLGPGRDVVERVRATVVTDVGDRLPRRWRTAPAAPSQVLSCLSSCHGSAPALPSGSSSPATGPARGIRRSRGTATRDGDGWVRLAPPRGPTGLSPTHHRRPLRHGRGGAANDRRGLGGKVTHADRQICAESLPIRQAPPPPAETPC